MFVYELSSSGFQSCCSHLKTENVTEKDNYARKEMTKNKNDIRSETEFTSVYDPLNMHRIASIETKTLNFMAPFYGCGSTASRLEPLQGGSLSSQKFLVLI